ncbi:MAG TPA: sugar phosphate nucleotidyltransferase [Candidatus Tectomicrobia bacterium]|nr:sugar phosphate nucleotidyltransferase [Candidatus Tectomicrobia bacterium]
MKVIVPVAGKGTRLRPHTHTKPKSLVRVAGKPILGHLVDRIRSLPIEELILIIDPEEAKEVSIRQFLEAAAPAPVRYVRQTELKGPAHAISLARDYIDQDVLIIFNDTLFDADLSLIETHQGDGMIWVREVEDPRRFGLVELEANRIVRLVEKPEVPLSNLAMIGMYYLKDGPGLMQRIERVMREGRTVKGEFYLPDPLQLMLDEGFRLEAAAVQGWYDCGTIEALLDTNRVLLENGHQKVVDTIESVIIPPVCIEEGACVCQSIVGPYVSIASQAVVERSVIRDSIINEGATVRDALLQRSLIGEQAFVKGGYKRLNVGDSSAVQGE